MEEDEIDALIADLSSQLIEYGFAWALEEVEAGLSLEADQRRVAIALVEAVESVTSDLARMELAIPEALKVKEVEFVAPPEARFPPRQPNEAFGVHRREMALKLAGLAAEYAELKERIRGERP